MTGQPPQDRSWDDLLGPDRDPEAALAEVRRSLGIGVPRVRHGDRPDVHGLAEDLGLGRPE